MLGFWVGFFFGWGLVAFLKLFHVIQFTRRVKCFAQNEYSKAFIFFKQIKDTLF